MPCLHSCALHDSAAAVFTLHLAFPASCNGWGGGHSSGSCSDGVSVADSVTPAGGGTVRFLAGGAAVL